MLKMKSNFSLLLDGDSMSMECNLSQYIFTENSSCLKTTSQPPIPPEVVFSDNSLFSVLAYSILFIFAAVGNLTVFITLFRNRHRKSRVNLFIMNLSVADLIVTFVMMPLEIGWHATVGWVAGDVMCRVMMFWRAFGFYLSSFILITISLDRYFAINHPLSLSDADKRGKIMLAFAWCFSIIASIPQSVIFHVEIHPRVPWFEQCVTFNFFPTPAHELAYNLFNLIALYAAPLIVIIISYSLILWEIHTRTKESKEQIRRHSKKNAVVLKRRRDTIRRSGMGRIEKARIRTLKMTIVIVIVFVACWTPYFVISAWWWIDKTSAGKINRKVQRTLFLFAVSNSCVNPIVYGMFTHTFMRELKRCYSWLCTSRQPREHPAYRTRSQSSSKKMHQHVLLQQSVPFAHRAKCRATNGPYSAPPRCPVQELMCTTCAVAISSDSDNPVFHMRIHRQLTPPHIAEGKGHTHEFDKYILL